jgi:NADH-quinone oxidoreductase subunit A
MSMLLLVPPVALTILVLVVWGLSGASGALSFKRTEAPGALAKPYAGGEDVKTHRVQVDYGQFFPFAFFFTILHVVTLIVATSPGRTLQSLAIGGVYVLGALLGMFVLLRR